MNDQTIEQTNSEPDELLNDHKAAKFLSSTSASVRQSRYTGILFGKPAPRFIKLGRSTRYRLSELRNFLDQFPEYQNTSEYAVVKGAKK
jgi:hypothetical protein